jgi:hypothetical protein
MRLRLLPANLFKHLDDFFHVLPSRGFPAGLLNLVHEPLYRLISTSI